MNTAIAQMMRRLRPAARPAPLSLATPAAPAAGTPATWTAPRTGGVQWDSSKAA